MPRPAAELVIVVFFCLTIAAAGLIDALFPATRPKLIGAEKRQDEALRENAQLRDGSRARLVERDRRLTSRVRRTVGPYYAFALFYFFGDAQGRLIAGRDGWLFLPGRTRILPRDDRAVAERSAALLAALERRLAAFGVRLVAVPVPRKSVVYRDFLPRGVDPRDELDEGLAAALSRRGVAFADLLDAFRRHRAARPRDLLFFQTDSHWTEAAQAIAAEETSRAAALLAPERERTSRLVSRGPAPQERDHLDYLGLHVPDRWIRLLDLPEVDALEVVPAVAREAVARREPDGPITLAGTSFTANRRFADFLEHFSQHPVRNAAAPGALPLESVLRLLRGRGAELPEVLVAEMPNHNVIGKRPLQLAAEVFAENPSSEDATVLELRRLPRRKDLRRRVDFQENLALGTLPPGALVHSGDGVAAVRLQGTLRGRGVRLVVKHGGGELSVPWPEHRRTLLLPLVDEAPTGKAAHVKLKGRGSIELESADVVASLDEARAVAGRRARVEPSGDGWRQRLVFPESPVVPRHAGLLLDLVFTGAFESRTLSLVVVTREGRAEPVELRPVKRQCTVLLSLHRYRGQRLRTLVLRGRGEPPSQVVRRVLLLPPAVPRITSRAGGAAASS